MLPVKRLLKSATRALGLDVFRSIPFGLRWEEDLAAFCAPTAALGGCVNVGQTALLLRRRFPSLRIWSFEPVPSTYAQLTEAVRPFPNVTPVRSALGAEPGTARITDSPTTGHNTLLVDRKNSDLNTIEVPVDTVDAFLERQHLERVDLLKIDTEGFEVAVLEGARSSLSSGAIPFVLVECDFFRRDEEPHGAFADIAGILLPLGYRVVSFYTGGVDGDGWRWGNVLFMRPQPGTRVRTSPRTRVEGL
jgi:FkbM family methyltransferase